MHLLVSELRRCLSRLRCVSFVVDLDGDRPQALRSFTGRPLGNSVCFVLGEKDEHGEGAKLSHCVLIIKGIRPSPCTISPGFVAFIKHRIRPGDIVFVWTTCFVLFSSCSIQIQNARDASQFVC